MKLRKPFLYVFTIISCFDCFSQSIPWDDDFLMHNPIMEHYYTKKGLLCNFEQIAQLKPQNIALAYKESSEFSWAGIKIRTLGCFCNNDNTVTLFLLKDIHNTNGILTQLGIYTINSSIPMQDAGVGSATPVALNVIKKGQDTVFIGVFVSQDQKLHVYEMEKKTIQVHDSIQYVPRKLYVASLESMINGQQISALVPCDFFDSVDVSSDFWVSGTNGLLRKVSLGMDSSINQIVYDTNIINFSFCNYGYAATDQGGIYAFNSGTQKFELLFADAGVPVNYVRNDCALGNQGVVVFKHPADGWKKYVLEPDRNYINGCVGATHQGFVATVTDQDWKQKTIVIQDSATRIVNVYPDTVRKYINGEPLVFNKFALCSLRIETRDPEGNNLAPGIFIKNSTTTELTTNVKTMLYPHDGGILRLASPLHLFNFSQKEFVYEAPLDSAGFSPIEPGDPIWISVLKKYPYTWLKNDTVIIVFPRDTLRIVAQLDDADIDHVLENNNAIEFSVTKQRGFFLIRLNQKKCTVKVFAINGKLVYEARNEAAEMLKIPENAMLGFRIVAIYTDNKITKSFKTINW